MRRLLLMLMYAQCVMTSVCVCVDVVGVMTEIVICVDWNCYCVFSVMLL